MIPLCILAIEDDSDRAFMEGLFLAYNRLAYHEIHKIIGNDESAEDVLQDSFVKLIDKIPKLREMDRDHLLNYVITTARNTALKLLRDRNRHSTYSLDDYNEVPDRDGRMTEEWLIRNSEKNALASVWGQLDDRTRYLLENRYFLEKTMTEMAEELGVKPDSVRMALARARRTAYGLLQARLEANKK